MHFSDNRSFYYVNPRKTLIPVIDAKKCSSCKDMVWLERMWINTRVIGCRCAHTYICKSCGKSKENVSAILKQLYKKPNIKLAPERRRRC